MAHSTSRSSIPQKIYTSSLGSSKASVANQQTIDRRINAPPRRLASFEEACEKETYARCLADLSRRSSRESGTPSMYLSQKLTSPRYPTFERSLSSSQLPRGDYGYIRNVRRPTSPRDTTHYSHPSFPSTKLMVRQHSEPGISSLHERRTAPSISSNQKVSRSVEALVSPTSASRQSPLTSRNLLKPSKTRGCKSLEAINEPTGNQVVSSHFVARIPRRKTSDSGVSDGKRGGASQHTVVKLAPKKKKNNTTQNTKADKSTSQNTKKDKKVTQQPVRKSVSVDDRSAQKPMRKSVSVDDRLCSGTYEREKHSKRPSSIPKAAITTSASPQSQSKTKKDQNDNDTTVFQVVAKPPDSAKSKVTVKNANKKQGKGKEKKVIEENDLKLSEDNQRQNNDVAEHRNQSNSKQRDEEQRMARSSFGDDPQQQQGKRASTKIPISSKVVGQLMIRQIVPDDMVLQDTVRNSLYETPSSPVSNVQDSPSTDHLEESPTKDVEHSMDMGHLVESPVKRREEEVVMCNQPQDIFSGVDLSSAIEPNLHGRLSPSNTLIPYMKPTSPPSSPVKKQQTDRIRREKMEMVIETNPPRMSLKKQVSFDVGMSLVREDGTKETSSFRTEQTEAIEMNDNLLFGSMFGWRESPTNSEVSSSDNLSDVFVDNEVLRDHEYQQKLLSVVEEIHLPPSNLSPEELSTVEENERKLERGRRGSDRRKTLPTKEAHIKSPEHARPSTMPGYVNRQKAWILEKSDKQGEDVDDSVLKIKLAKPKAFSSKNAKLMDRRKAYAKNRSISEGNMFSALNTKAAKLGSGSQVSSPTTNTVARSPLMSPFLGLRRMLSRESGRWSPGSTRKADAKGNTGSGSPKPKRKRFYGVCRACGFDVMAGEQMSVHQWVYHQDCFKCSRAEGFECGGAKGMNA